MRKYFRRCIYIEKVKEKKIIKQEVKAKGQSKPKELVQRGLQNGIERIGQNIREAGEPLSREEQRENQFSYGVNKTEAAAGAVAQIAYVQGRKMAQQQLKGKNERQAEANEKIEQKTGQEANGEPSPDPKFEPMPEAIPMPEIESHYSVEKMTVSDRPNIKRREPENKVHSNLDSVLDDKKEIKIRAADNIIKEKPSGRSNMPSSLRNRSVREKPVLDVSYNAKAAVSENKAEPNLQNRNLSLCPKNKIKVLDKGSIKTKKAATVNTSAGSLVNTDGERFVGVDIVNDGRQTVGSRIKTRAAYRADEIAAENNPEKQAAVKIVQKQGRKLAERQRQAKQQDNAAWESKDIDEERSVNQEAVDNQELSVQVEKKPAYIRSQVQASQSMKAPAQARAGNIKTREYVRQREYEVNIVRENDLQQPVLFGKAVSSDVKSAGRTGEKATTQGSLAGVSEKVQKRQKALWVQQVRCAASNRALNNNGFSYISKQGKRTDKLRQILYRLVPKNGKEMLAGIMGFGCVLAIVIIICLIGSLFASPFGILFSGADTMNEAVSELNREFSQRIEQIKAANSYDELQFSNAGSSVMAANWPDVLAVYAVLTTMDDSNPYDAITLDAAKKARLREIFWAMNQVSYEVRTEYRENIDAEIEVLYISVAEKNCWQMADEYAFSQEQRQMLAELKKPEYIEMFMALAGSYRDIALTPEEIEAVIANLPADLSEARRQVVLTAYQLEGKVSYFWGGKSLVLGWDSRWGTPQEVWAAGSVTTGTVRPLGLDCSGFVDWVFYNASGGSFVMGRGGGAASQHNYCTPISWTEAKPGDLVFYPDDSHVGIVCGFDSRGNVQIIHCAAGYNNVVVTGKSGFTAVGRPDYFAD